MGLSVFVYKMEIIISHRWSWGLVSTQEVAALRWEIQMPFTGNPLLLPYTGEKPWSAVRTGYHILHSPIFSSLEPLGNWPTYSHSTLDLQSSVTDVWQRVEIFNLKSWPVFTASSSNLNAISVSLSQPVSSLQRTQVLSLLVLLSPEHSQKLSQLSHCNQLVGLISFWPDQKSDDFWKICHDVWVCSLII